MTRLRLLTRVAMFSALVYVANFALAWIPNVKLGYFIIFAAGYLWGLKAGIGVGAIGQGMFTLFNPFGPAALPVMIAQIFGGAAMGAVGAWWQKYRVHEKGAKSAVFFCVLAGIVCTLVYFIPVNIVDAWLLQPFWVQLVGSLSFTMIALVANALIFPLLFPIVAYLYRREWLEH
jgi:uncharacterized membrane protein